MFKSASKLRELIIKHVIFERGGTEIMLKTKINDSDTIDIPVRIAKKFSLKDGVIVEARVEKGKLLILGKKIKLQKSCSLPGYGRVKTSIRFFVRYAGIGTHGKRTCLYRH